MRVLARSGARELSVDELTKVSGGTHTIACYMSRATPANTNLQDCQWDGGA